MKRLIAGLTVAVLAGCGSRVEAPSPGASLAVVRAELERRYEDNNAAYLRWDLPAILAVRAPGFHAVGPDGAVRDSAAMAHYIEGLLNGIREWNRLTITIDSLRVSGDTAWAETSQHVDRIALRPDNQYHHVQTWVKQRETWIRIGDQWFMWRVDNVRDQRRLIDGQPG